VGGLPNEASEAAIREFAAQAGEVYNLRVPRDHAQNTNKG
jgi:RNA recognition motif-containing protein